MDQKKILWVVAAVGIFLVTVIALALFIYTPSKNDEIVAKTDGEPVWAMPPTTKADGGSSQAICQYDASGISGIDLDALGNIAANTAAENALTTIGGSAATPPAPKPAPAKPAAPAVKVEAKKPAPAKQVKAAAPAPKPAPKNVSYWVQAVAFIEQVYADLARETLTQHKIDSEVFTKEQNGKLWYRVRVGPYKTKSEAEYWQSIVRDIRTPKGEKLFEKAFIATVEQPK